MSALSFFGNLLLLRLPTLQQRNPIDWFLSSIGVCAGTVMSSDVRRSGRRHHVVDFRRLHLKAVDVINVSLLLLILRSPAVSAVVRCYCNDAHCVNTGYICKSEIGLCYTAVTSSAHPDAATDNRWSSAPRGCVDFLSTPSGAAPASSCRSDIEESSSSGSSRQPTESGYQLDLVCCQHDLCNYADGSRTMGRVETVGVDDDYSDQSHVEDSYEQRSAIGIRSTSLSPPLPPPPGVLDATDQWFRAAVITVPIAGLILLILLVLVAVHMLHDDRRRRPAAPAGLYDGRLSSADIRRLRCHPRQTPSRTVCRCGDRAASDVSGDCAGSRYEKMVSCESVASGLQARDVIAADLALRDRVTSYGVLLDGVVGADDVICTFTDDASVSLV